MLVNVKGDEVYERQLFAGDLQADNEQLCTVVALLLERLELEAVWTNATKHGRFEVELRSTKAEIRYQSAAEASEALRKAQAKRDKRAERNLRNVK